MMLNKHFLYRLLRVEPEYLKILQEGVEESVSINRIIFEAQEGHNLYQRLKRSVKSNQKSHQSTSRLQYI